MSSPNKGVRTVEVALRWDPSPLGRSPHDLDIVAATYRKDAPSGDPAYVVHFGNRSPDGTISLTRDSRTGQGFGSDEVMKLELERLSTEYGRVVVGVVIQQANGRLAFEDVANAQVKVAEGYTELDSDDFSSVPGSTAAVIAEFVRGDTGSWVFHDGVRGFDTDPEGFVTLMGRG
ncbi:TerD family protein [Streptomyces qinzhouensis]|uniref:TerD family protein n=1 Tax=Streptomyces qinzhouensis TaxID=2599401 RepID=A0A5B8ILF9_9ACTN|nr:TerD family protein [Streptomyces qinzhouensis]QDY79388.1 TerD family protein [Streptomyces qinzhouensis]